MTAPMRPQPHVHFISSRIPLHGTVGLGLGEAVTHAAVSQPPCQGVTVVNRYSSAVVGAEAPLISGPCTLDHGAFGVGGVDPFEGSFVWTTSLFTNQYQSKLCR